MIRDLAPLIGRRLSFGVVPNWHGEWPLAAHQDYCQLLSESSEELLLHGYFHQRQRGWGPTTLLAGGCDEMNGLDVEETRRTFVRGQSAFIDAFSEPAQGFLAPGWQVGQVRCNSTVAPGLEYILGFFSIETREGHSVPLATRTWDCGRWAALGHIGHGLGWLLQSMHHRVPTLAIHPIDIERGFWPKILELTTGLLERGYRPSTVEGLLNARC